MKATRCTVSVAAISIAVLAAASGAPAQTPQADAWKLVPAPAASCFRDDEFDVKLGAALEALDAARAKQEAINAVARGSYDQMDMGERMQRMQAFMMKNPQQAMKMMQAVQTSGASSGGVVAADGAAKRLLAELPKLQAGFRAALEQAVQPVHAKQTAFIEAKTVPVGEVQAPMFTNAADHAQYVQLIAEENAVIERACAPFFGVNGTFHKWLASYRSEVVEQIMNVGDDTDTFVGQLTAMGLPDGGYRSTGPFQQAGNYVRQLSAVYGVRPFKVQPRIGIR